MPSVQDDLFPIRTVSSLTGVNAITLRAWERRYGLITPVRTPTGHRLYRREDIDRIHRALALTGKGVSIGQVKQSLDAAEAAPARDDSPWRSHLERMVSAVARFDDGELERVYNQALAAFPMEAVTDRLLLPLLKELGRRWESAEGSVAEEHFFGAYLRNELGARFHHRARDRSGPRLLAACLPGEQHEVGLLLFALAAHESGLRPLLLGADLPVAIERARARAVVLSGTLLPERDVLRRQLPALVAATRAPVFVGGPLAITRHDAIVAAGALPLGVDIPAAVKRIRSTLGPDRARASEE